MNGSGPLHFNSTLNDNDFRSALNRMERGIQGVANTTVQASNTIDRQFSRLGQLAAGYFSFQALTELPAQIFKVRGEFQQLEISFTTMLRSKTKADALLGDLVQTAASTPFGLKDIATGAKQLLAYGSSAGSVIKEIRTLGDVAAGTSVPINDLIYLYGTLRSQGRAYAVDIRQFAGRGIPIYAELAKVLGVSVDKVNDFVSSGKVGFKEVEQAFKNMTTEGGLFQGTLDAQSKSLIGLKERLSDAFDIALNDIGKANEGTIAEVINLTTSAVQNYQQIVDILKVAAATYGAYKAAILLASVAQSGNIAITEAQAIAQAQAASSGGFLTLSQTRAAASTALLTRAQVALNAAFAINPIVLIGTAIVALTAAYFTFREETQKIQTAQSLLANSAKDISDKFSTQKAEVSTLISVLKNQNIAESERLKAYDQLKAISPDIVAGLDFQQAKTADLTKSLNEYLVALKQRIRLEAGQENLKIAYKQEFEATENKIKAERELKKAVEQTDAAEKKRGSRNVSADGSGNAAGAAGALNIAVAKKKLDELTAIENQAAAERVRTEAAYGRIVQGNSKVAINAKIKEQEVILATANKTSLAYKQAEDQIAALTKQRDALTASEAAGQTVAAKTVADYEALIKQKKELQDSTSSRADFAKLQKEIEGYEAAKRRITGELTKDQKKAVKEAQKEAEKAGAFGSLDYYEQISRRADELAQKLGPDQANRIAKLNQVKFDADAKAEQLRKERAIKSFDEEIQYKQTQYELYQKFITAYGKESADAQFADLRKSGESYLDFINAQIAGLENERANAGLTPKQTDNLGLLLGQRSDITGQKTAIDSFSEGLQKAQREAGSLSDYLVILNDKQNALNTKKPVSKEDFEIRKQLAEEIVKTQNQLQDQLKEFLVSYEGSEQKQTAIRKQYSELRAELDRKYLNNRGSEYNRALGVINAGEERAIVDFQRSQLEQTEEYKKTTKVILEEGAKRLKIEIANQQRVVDKTKELFGVQSEIYKEQQAKLNALTKQDGGTGTQKLIGQYSRYIGEFGTVLSQLGGKAGELGNTLTAVAGSLDTISLAFSKGMEPAQAYGVIIQGTINLLGSLANAAEKRKQVQEAYSQSLVNKETEQYNLLLKEQIELRNQSRENIFIRDYAQEIKDDLSTLSEAQAAYQKSLAKLDEGRAKTGLKNQLDGKDALKLIGTGAATGAALGSIVPVIGTAIGAVGGAIVGGLTALFGGATKKAEEFGNLLQTYPDLLTKGKDGVYGINTALAQTLINQNLVDDKTKQLIQTTLDWQKQVDEAKEAIRAVVKELAGGLGGELRSALVTAFEDGTSAADAFGKSVSNTLENILSNLLFNQVFAKEFKTLSDELEASFSTDGIVTDDFARFYAKSGDLIKQFNEGLTAAQEEAAKSGLTIFKPNGANSGSGPKSNSLSGAIQGIEEKTANVLAGQLNAIRITQAETGGVIRQQLVALNNISVNSNYLPLLDSIDRGIKSLASDPLRPKGS